MSPPNRATRRAARRTTRGHRLVRVDETSPGDTLVGTWSHQWPQPRRLASREPAPEHSVTGQAWRLHFTDGDSTVLYSHTGVVRTTKP